MTDEPTKQPVPWTTPDPEKLAFVQGFLLVLARRLDDAYKLSTWMGGEQAASDCRQVAAMIARCDVKMDKAP